MQYRCFSNGNLQKALRTEGLINLLEEIELEWSLFRVGWNVGKRTSNLLKIYFFP